jgi:hypothetical protein
VAPYAFLYARDVQYDDADSLRSTMRLGRTRVMAGTATFPSHDDIAKYQAILDTPSGVKRASGFGEVPFPGSATAPMRNFDDFRYGPESMEEAASRLLSCLRAPSERAAFRQVLGRAPCGDAAASVIEGDEARA